MVPPCHHVQPAAPVFGHNAGRDFMRRHGRGFNAKAKAEAMGIDWMTRDEVSEAVPPAFTEHIGGYLMRAVTMEQAA
jgi:DNA (cytosine-5)-methyltransferase 1